MSQPKETDTAIHIIKKVVNSGLCANCGACELYVTKGSCKMSYTPRGVEPSFSSDAELDDKILQACPGVGINYPQLHEGLYGTPCANAMIGNVDRLWVGYSADATIRRKGASGGVMTAVLCYMLENGFVDAVIVAKQGIPEPSQAGWFIADSTEQIIACAQSVYVPVAMLSSLEHLDPLKRYAITCVPEQSSALRVLQAQGNKFALAIKYVLGPYTGTALQPAAIDALLRANKIDKNDKIKSLQWRAGEWPGYLEIVTEAGKVIRSKKVYYNFLIPFYVTTTSLLSMDFANEFADLAVGDAWSPAYEKLGQGFSVVLSRNPAMTAILEKMGSKLSLVSKDPLEASSMHGHMIDFKKRGGYIRRRLLQCLGRQVPKTYAYPDSISRMRIATELVISSILAVCRTGFARYLMCKTPEKILGYCFNKLRLFWKQISKPVKRKGLRSMNMIIVKEDNGL